MPRSRLCELFLFTPCSVTWGIATLPVSNQQPAHDHTEVLLSFHLSLNGEAGASVDFETLTRELFKLQFEESGVGGQGSRFMSDDLSSLLESPTNTPSLSDSDDLEEMERLRKDHIEALREIKKLQEQLAESERLHLQMQEELNRVKQEVRSGTDEWGKPRLCADEPDPTWL
ncbi:hypothetical protein J4Q44_G00004180 [Coregonus suidteri]|uniref:Uncharacterized protein n=1 Tax=Coregonus suidteri TaxID=861788 RepID=A0AAN8MCL7_9TELE